MNEEQSPPSKAKKKVAPGTLALLVRKTRFARSRFWFHSIRPFSKTR